MNKFMLVGLGNPGKEYEITRHNAGKLFARYLREHPIDGVEAIETECYMNESGSWLQRELQRRGLWEVSRESRVSREDETHTPNSSQPSSQFITNNSQLIVAHDDLDIPLGLFKIQFGRGPRQHKGVLSIEEALGTTEFWRVRLGIGGNQFQDLKSQISNLKSFGEEYVLQPFSRAERKTLETVFPGVQEQLCVLFRSI